MKLFFIYKLNFLFKKLFKVAFPAFIIYFIFCLPTPLFKSSYSRILLDKNDELLEARISKDEQWRFPLIDSVPHKFKTCIVEFEDKNFNRHFGINPLATARALFLNIKYGRIMSGGSTLTMQTIRLARGNRKRSYSEKIVEMVWACRLEFSLSKKEILRKYATHAPFGGNVVGLETASWRYFKRSPHNLSWAESAMLSVLPNAPGLIHLNKNRKALVTKRNKLLHKLFEQGKINKQTLALAKAESLPQKLNHLPNHSFHLVNRFQEKEVSRIRSTIDLNTQKQLNSVCQNYYNAIQSKGIANMAAVVIDVETKEVMAYVGNIRNSKKNGNVDNLQSVRSSGSILKPLLYAAAVDNGVITPEELLPDIPSNYSGYTPQNYIHNFDGMVNANEALYRSLNIPAVWLLREQGAAVFKRQLQMAGLSSINKSINHYGLSLILGGAEVNLLELSNAYAHMAYQLNHIDSNATYTLALERNITSNITSNLKLGRGSIYSTFNALTNTRRPDTEAYWQNFHSSHKIAWKTGTSFGNRDAWAVGITSKYVVGVWVGNSNGESAPDLIGVRTAGPLLFKVFDFLPTGEWFSPPHADLYLDKTCKESGKRASHHCPHKVNTYLPKASRNNKPCTYHKRVLLTENGKHRVYKSENHTDYKDSVFFVLPGVMANYYQKKHPNYIALPSFIGKEIAVIEKINLIYPRNNEKILLPKKLNEEKGQLNCKAICRTDNKKLYWFLNQTLVGTTEQFHELSLSPSYGKNQLQIVDASGNSTQCNFEMVL